MTPTAPALDVFAVPLAGTTLVEASAGTGKTWNLCGLVLRLLLERELAIGQILVVTFTNAATAELRDRIRARIAETLARLRGGAPAGGDPFVPALLARLRAQGLDDAAMAGRLDEALQTFDDAAIFTIHGFCQRALADTPFSAGVPMRLELLADDSTLRLQTAQDHWRRHVAGAALPPGLAAELLRHGDSPERWARPLAHRLRKPLARLRWPDGIDTAELPDLGELADAHAAACAEWADARDEIVQIVGVPGRLHAGTFRPGALDTAAASWDRWLECADPLAAGNELEKLALLRRSTLDRALRKNQPRPEHAFFDLAEAALALRERALDALAMARLRLLRALLIDGPAALREAKRERRVQSFDDMLFNLHQHLTAPGGTALAALLRQRFPAALIDEFQDTDPLQFAIFDALYGDGRAPLFLLGDPKQAIYSFRGADLHTYLAARKQAAAEYTLADNQRATPPLIDALNALFGGHPQAFMLPGLDYRPVRSGARERAPLHDHTAARAALQLWSLPDEPLAKPDAHRTAAAATAAEIARLLAAAQRGDVRLGERPLAGGDIAVLVRSHGQGGLVRQALAALGVPSVELSQASVFASPDAEALAQVLAAVLEPARERNLRAALATEAMGWDAARLHALGDDEAAWGELAARFAAYRDTWLQRGIGVMLREWMAGEGVTARLLARADGERRLTNLRHLAECLQQAAQQHPAPDALLRWLLLQRDDPRGSETTQLRLESDRHLVQVVTIHKSKGLEYPIVFCPFLWDGHPGPTPDALEGRDLHDADGHAVIDFRSQPDDGAKAQMRRERAAETLRLIYVALTRAVHRCHVVIGRYTARTSTKEGDGSLLNWLVAGSGRTPDEWLTKGPQAAAALPAAWQALADANPGAIALTALPETAGVPLPPQAPAASGIVALPAVLPPAPWWIGSYSALTHGARHERAAADHDLHLPAATPPTPEDSPVLAPDDILLFPRGPAAGDSLHAVFERIEFDRPDGWPAAIAASLLGRPPASPDADGTGWPAMLLRMLHDVLHTPLPAGLRLAELPRARRLVELEFNLPVAHLGDAALAAALHALGYPAPPLAFGSLRGYLRGFIDLVFEHQGRYFVADWKSNHLGTGPTDYAAPALADAMHAHGYTLQGLLYTLALHRFLGRRLPGYRYEQHVGGYLYLFVRGMRPDWRMADGSPCGVHAHCPPLAAIERLDALMRTESFA